MGEEGGRDDDLFGEQCRKDVGDILGVLNDQRFEAFWIVLRTECLNIHRGIATSPNSFKKYAPFDASLTQRVKWLETNVLKPIARLEKALSDANRPYFNHWSNYGDNEHPFTDGLLTAILALKQNAQDLSDWLSEEITGEIAGKISHTNEIRSYIVYFALSTVQAHFPELRLSRGNWDKKLKTMEGRTPAYVRRVFLETTGRHEALDNKIADFN